MEGRALSRFVEQRREAVEDLCTRFRVRRLDLFGSAVTERYGICMSALHHVAFDSHLIGVDPDYGIHVSSQSRRSQSRRKRDGELLEGLKGLDGSRLTLPEDPDDRPMRDYLERRFARYRQTLG